MDDDIGTVEVKAGEYVIRVGDIHLLDIDAGYVEVGREDIHEFEAELSPATCNQDFFNPAGFLVFKLLT